MVKKRNLLVGVAVAAVLVCAVLLFLFVWEKPAKDDMLAVLPQPSTSRPYALLETKEGHYPGALSSLMTEGPWAMLHKGTSRNMLMQLATLAEDVAMLVEDEEETGYTEVYAAMRFAPHEMKKLEQGVLPESWKNLFDVAAAGNEVTVEKGTADASWEIWGSGIDAPIFYYVRGNFVVLAGEETPFNALLAIRDKTDADRWTHTWRDESAWSSHIEFGDGGLILQQDKKSQPLNLQVAWNPMPSDSAGDRKGEARWSISGLRASQKAALFLSAKPREWVVSDCIVPEPILLSAALNIPEMKEPPEKWPFPLDGLVQLGKSIGLNDTQIREIASGRTLVSLGGQNRILWFTLPGVLAEFTGDKRVMREMVDAFWDKFFFGSNPRPIEGFEYGGWINIPFSVIGASRDDLTVVGLISPESIRTGGDLGKYLRTDEKAIGWLVADLPRLGSALGDMTRISSLLMFEDGEGPGFISGSEESSGSGYFFSDLDQSVSDSFARILQKFGKVAIIWEKSESGRMEWYR
ncbi:hypothetical protein LJC40_03580 [Synergistaceae bacterium OttesenSCG-928-D05]|nr:hypothetical protein [Synergistaceae bacterium OttesenSCG-928-D05]